ncbi:hypothetical protein [Rubripirellula reticaptiva]|uniref:Uncharacterized protein n=1 Tax=Rubripirellula reticaptiva TaxID=2528013 RepID=A0A5C6EME2_9BACT|nr:hypothetical protein [Rubripirellula reticaptiva]TWU49307.1 hypothetical protein Poly59_39210 [Rubripirellula reticaptiva]
MTQLQAMHGYNQQRTPQEELEHAKQLVIEAESDCRFYEDSFADIDDNAVYEIRSGGYDNPCWLHKREIVKRTPKQIRLAAKHAGEKQTCLPRERLESGRSVAKGDTLRDPVYALGWVMRTMFQELKAKSTRRLEDSRRILQSVEGAIGNSKHDWKEEGF